MTDQELWDDILIKGWDKDISMHQAIEQMKLNGVSINPHTILEDTSHLLRISKNPNNLFRMSIRQFVSAEMNWLSNYLWNTFEKYVVNKKLRDSFIKKLTASEYTVGDFDKKKRAAWIAKKRKAKQEAARNIAVTNIIGRKKDTNKNDWGTVTPTGRGSKSHRLHK